MGDGPTVYIHHLWTRAGRLWVDYREIAGRDVENQYCSKTFSPPPHSRSHLTCLNLFGFQRLDFCFILLEVATAKSVAKTTSRIVVLEFKRMNDHLYAGPAHSKSEVLGAVSRGA